MAQTGKDRQPEEPPPRRNWAGPVGRDIASAASQAFARAGFTDPTLVLHWAEIVGPEIARIARPVRLSDGVLTLRAEPGATVFLQHEARILCERINTFLGRPAVARMRLVQGAVTPARLRPIARRVPSAVSAGDPILAFSGSESLREALLRLARARKSGGTPAN